MTKNTEERLLTYLQSLIFTVAKTDIHHKRINIARSYWVAFKYKALNSSKILLVPNIAVDPESLVITYSWEKDEHNLSCVVDTETSTYHYSNSQTNESWNKLFEPRKEKVLGISEDIYSKVLLFTE